MTIIIRRKGYGTALKQAFKTVLLEKLAKIRLQDVPVLPWGFAFKADAKNIINSRQAVLLLADKPRFRKLLEPSKVRIPHTLYNLIDACNFFQDTHSTLIGRPRYHFAAKNFWVCTSLEHIAESQRAGCVYWQELLPKSREFRIFVAFGRVWAFLEKLVEDKNQPAWNHSRGAQFVILPRSQWLSKACWYALEAQRLSGIDLAAFDLILSDGKLYLLEGNTAPAITGEYKQKLLQKIFTWIDTVYQETGSLPKHYPVPDENTKGYKGYLLEVL